MGKEVIRRAAKEAKREKVVKKASILVMVNMNMSGKKNGTKEVVRRVAKEVKKERGMVVGKDPNMMMENMNMSGKKNGVKAIKEEMEVAKKERRAIKDPIHNQVMVT